MSTSRHPRRFWRDESGTTMVELAFVIALFLLIFFMLLDFGRMSYNWVMAEKAMQMAARTAAVRPAVCAGVPQYNLRGIDTSQRFGASCRGGADICQVVSVSCPGVAGNATTDEIWSGIAPLLPGNATPANLQFTYSFDPDMNFLGGPYVPVVTVEISNNGDSDCSDPGELCFRFASPLAGLARIAGATNTADQQAREQNGIPFPSMSVSLPGEDLALGDAG